MIDIIAKHVIPAAMSILPEKMDTIPARVMLIAIALQESKLEHRKQIPVSHARSFWQFEEGRPELKSGLAGVRIHKWTYKYYRDILDALKYQGNISDYHVHRIIEHNDILACAMARLLLYTVPRPLPGLDDFDEAWEQYIFAWRPGKPHRETWNDNYNEGWKYVY